MLCSSYRNNRSRATFPNSFGKMTPGDGNRKIVEINWFWIDSALWRMVLEKKCVFFSAENQPRRVQGSCSFESFTTNNRTRCSKEVVIEHASRLCWYLVLQSNLIEGWLTSKLTSKPLVRLNCLGFSPNKEVEALSFFFKTEQ